ncbi:MAG TPA: hotdog domain-containing protein [Kineosporiaceae bacterium]|nr:hotdog domain-containing protein [Kineosporiaceae bacterium]
MTTLEFQVRDADTARALGSGDIDVLATPRLLAWCEAATVAALAEQLTPERTSVGSRVQLDHLAATPVGGTVTVTAELEHQDGRLVRFSVSAVDRAGRLIGAGEVTRVIVDRQRFAARMPPP